MQKLIFFQRPMQIHRLTPQEKETLHLLKQVFCDVDGKVVECTFLAAGGQLVNCFNALCHLTGSKQLLPALADVRGMMEQEFEKVRDGTVKSASAKLEEGTADTTKSGAGGTSVFSSFMSMAETFYSSTTKGAPVE